MQVRVITLLIGIGLGAVAGVLISSGFSSSGSSDQRFAQPLEAQLHPEAATISIAETETLRHNRYQAVTSIAETLALPTEFARNEALYALVGRADSGDLQDFLYQAAQIRNSTQRNATLTIIFRRLTELDRKSALAIARSPAFAANSLMQRTIWSVWAGLDFEDALAAATDDDRNSLYATAQDLYLALDSLDSLEAERISEAFGIQPGIAAHVQHIKNLADYSVAEAITYVEGQSNAFQKQQMLAQLAIHLQNNGMASVDRYAELIETRQDREMFRMIANSLATVNKDPEDALREVLEGPQDDNTFAQSYFAIQQFASVDPEKALSYLSQITDSRRRAQFENIVLTQMAANEPDQALAAARLLEQNGSKGSVDAVISGIAMTDPDRALLEARLLPDVKTRSRTVSKIVGNVARTDPQKAKLLFQDILEPELRSASLSTLASNWSQTDFEQAVLWAETLGSDDQQAAVSQMSQSLVFRDLDNAISLHKRFPKSISSAKKQQLIQKLVEQRSIDEAETYVRELEDNSNQMEMKQSLIRAASIKDPARAMVLANEVTQPNVRDSLVANIISSQIDREPELALQWLQTIEGEKERQKAIASVARKWSAKDEVAATQWIQNMPQGVERDGAIFATLRHQTSPSARVENLINSMSSADSRKRARLYQVRKLANYDPKEAQRILSTLELTDQDRERLDKVLDRSQFSY